jgi:hypothetical protein
MIEGGFNLTVTLPFDGKEKRLLNPLYSRETSHCLQSEWLKKPSLWSRGIIDLLEKAHDMETDGSNQLSEAIFKNVKHNQGVHDHVFEPAACIRHRWDDSNKSERLFIEQSEVLQKRLEGTVARRDARPGDEQDTTDVRNQKEEEDAEQLWSRKGAPQETDTLLRNTMKKFFLNKKAHSAKKAHQHIVNSVHPDSRQEDLKCCSYQKFNNFWTGEKSPKKGHGEDFLGALGKFVERECTGGEKHTNIVEV